MINITNNSKAFTLAQVLITLGIIGVVAAMTIPTLIANYQKKVTVTKLQKTLSVMSNGYRLMMAEEGVENIKNLKVFKCNKSDDNYKECLDANFGRVFKFAKSYYGTFSDASSFYPVYNIKLLNGNENSLLGVSIFGDYIFWLSDGVLVSPVLASDVNVDVPLSGFIDVNGASSPNQVGHDIFYYNINDEGVFTPYGAGGGWDDTAKNLDYCGDDTSAWSAGYACAGRIFDEGWKINY